MPDTPGLLVSVRSADEVDDALAGGADLIDVKEPSRGALGMLRERQHFSSPSNEQQRNPCNSCATRGGCWLWG